MNRKNTEFKFRYILNPVFVISLILLIANDFYFKIQFNNWITGKLSDFAGIVVFILFFSVFFKGKKSVFVVSALLFTLWKSSLSQPLIDFWNQISLYSIDRVTDYSDLACLLVLIPLYYFEPKKVTLLNSLTKKIAIYPLIVISIFSMIATSRAPHFKMNIILIDESVKIKLTKEDFLDKLTEKDVSYELDTTIVFEKYVVEKYILDNIVLDSDTIFETHIGIEEKKRKLVVDINMVKFGEDNFVTVFGGYKNLKKIEKKYGDKIVDYLKALNK